MSSASLSMAPATAANTLPLTGWERLKLDRLAMVALGVLLASALACFLIPPLMDAARNSTSAATYAPPGTWVSTAEGGRYHATLGTDSNGRDLLYRVLSGGRVSLIVGLCAAAVSLFIGTLVGMTAGFYGGKVDSFLMRLVDVLYANPRVLFVLILISALTGPLNLGITTARNWAEIHHHATLKAWIDGAIPYQRTIILIFCLGFIEWLTMARIVRGQVLVLKEQQFISAARVIGQSPWNIMRRHLLPNLWTVILTYLTLTVPIVVLDESFLSFLGLGIEEPAASWGTLLKEGAGAVNALISRWWLLVTPAVAMGTALLALNFLGDALRDTFDVK